MLIERARLVLLVLLMTLLGACHGGGDAGEQPRAPDRVTLGLTEVASASAPMFLTAPAGDARLFIVERAGRVRLLQNGVLRAAPFLDISARVSTEGEGGLLSLAFDPQYPLNGHFFLYYTNSDGNIVVERGSVSADPGVADPLAWLPLLEIDHPLYRNHYGGLLGFGPDGFLYIGTGDGGGAGDPQGNAQNRAALLGKMLRIDVAGATVARRYTIPATNPFVGQAGARAEVWALGLRNPWRWTFDGARLYIADVGQASREELNVADASAAGLNYGWNLMEGSACFTAGCSQAGLTLPAFEYEHGPANANGCSITGGFVYRGGAIPELAGHYFYADYCAGFLRSLRYRDGRAGPARDWPIGDIGNIVSFGRDGNGELYLLSASGKIYKIVKTAPPG